MGRKFICFLVMLLIVLRMEVQAQNKLTRAEYIEKYKELAIEEMERSGIPASITLAQGLLESNNGNSTLAIKSNNHFGIKCHTWKGKKVYHDDDAKGECFRKYKSVKESYRDHTDYLMNNPRYTFLFAYSYTDYKSWAKGLKRAGYATASHYSDMLIKIIIDNNLHQYDSGGISTTPLAKGRKVKKNTVWEDDEFTVSLSTRQIQENNRIDYIVVKEGDTFEKLTVELELLEWELYKYNNLNENARLKPGQLLYLQPKRNRAARGNDYHWVEPGETMYTISQKYGMKLKKLYKKNLMTAGSEPSIGQKIWLRKKKKE